MTEKLEKAISTSLQSRKIEDMYELVDAIKVSSNSTMQDELVLDHVDEHIIKNGITDIFMNYEREEVVYREKTFQTSSFRIQLTDTELSQERLIVGHRFLPFIHPKISPKKITLVDNNDQAIELKSEYIAYTDVIIFFSLLPPYGFNHYDLNDKGEINLFYFDIKSWLKKNEFSIKDNLLISPVDYAKNIFRIEKISSREIATQKIVSNQLEAELGKIIDNLLFMETLMLPIDMQLFHAFALLSENFKNKICPPIGPFISNNSEINIYNNGTYAFLNTERNQSNMFEDALDEAMFPDLSNMGTANNLNGIFREMGNSYGEIYVEAKFIEQLHERKKLDKDELFSILFGNISNPFFNEQQESNFQKAFDQLANDTNKKWKDTSLGLPLKRLLTNALKFKVDIIQFLRAIDKKLEDPENFDFGILMQFQPFEMLTDQLLQAIVEDSENISPTMTKQLNDQITFMKEEFRVASNHLLEQI